MADSPGKALRVAGMIVGGIGLLFGIAGFVLWRYGPPMAAAEHARLEALPAPDAISIGDTKPGTEVIVEGTIAANQPALFREFVSYVKEEEERDAKTRERTGSRWKTVEKVTPPLDLVTGDGMVRIVNTNYSISFAKTNWSDTSKVIDTNYRGLAAKEAVFVQGRVTAGGLEASIVGSGTRASYLAMMAGNIAVVWWLGVGFIALGVLLLTIATVLFVMAVRSRTAASR